MTLKIKKINFNNKIISVYIVESFIDKIRGATIFNDVPKNADGMLFIGYNRLYKDIWMNGMKFPLNIYFLDRNMNVITYYENAKPCNKFIGIGCKKYKSVKRYYYILELW